MRNFDWVGSNTPLAVIMYRCLLSVRFFSGQRELMREVHLRVNGQATLFPFRGFEEVRIRRELGLI